jgi:hypothetical protein
MMMMMMMMITITNIRDLYRGINDFKKNYQPRTNRVGDEKRNLVTDSHSSLARWRNHFSQLSNVHGVSSVRQTEIHTAESLVPEPSAFLVDRATEKLKRHKSQGSDQIPLELIKAGGRTIRSDIYKFINSIWKKEEFPEQWKESITVPIYKKGDRTDCSNYRGISLLSATYKFYPTSCCHGYVHMQRKLLCIINVDFDATDQLLIIHPAYVKYLRKNGNATKQCIGS